MDPAQHKQYVDYRELFTYFGRNKMVILSAAEFLAADAELRELHGKGAERDAGEEARVRELERILFRD
jgi:hypothetical protein